MNDAVRYLLPAIPTLLYGGLGRHQVERLSVTRKACMFAWERYAKGRTLVQDFDDFFQEVLSQFDTQADEFAPQRVQDELIGQMSELLSIDYDVLALDLTESESRHRALVSDPTPPSAPPALPEPETIARPPTAPTPSTAAPATAVQPREDDSDSGESSAGSPAFGDRLQGHVVSPAPTTERLQSIQRMVADELGDALPDFSANVLQSIPVQAGGLYPISDIWHIDPGLDTPDRLRIHIAQFAREIEARRIDVHRDDRGGARDLGRHDRAQAHRPGTKGHEAGAGMDLERIQDRACSGLDTATQRPDQFERYILGHAHHIALVGQGIFGEGGLPEEVIRHRVAMGIRG
jgi:hypothetical protein